MVSTEWDHLKEARLGTVQYHPEDSLSFWAGGLWEYADLASAMVSICVHEDSRGRRIEDSS